MAFSNPDVYSGDVGSRIIRPLLIHFTPENHPQIHRYHYAKFRQLEIEF
ncbi:hypothetical protein G6M16_015100 [Agrobacterium tumefaciens]|nr:hypothetical protein G6M16_015100 [Agrobacterium tumefaciens]